MANDPDARRLADCYQACEGVVFAFGSKSRGVVRRLYYMLGRLTREVNSGTVKAETYNRARALLDSLMIVEEDTDGPQVSIEAGGNGEHEEEEEEGEAQSEGREEEGGGAPSGRA